MRTSVVVTGGAGFIGSHVAASFIRAGADVLVVDDLSRGRERTVPAGARLVVTDVASAEAREQIVESGPSIVVHCAAQASVPRSFEDPAQDARTNIIGTLQVIAAAGAVPGCRLVHLTTAGALFGAEMIRPWTEDDPVEPLSPYGLAKWTSERYVRLLLGDSRAVVLRLANVYGPGQEVSGEGAVVPAFISRMLAGQDVVIDGDGEQTRDFVFVEDVVDAVLAGARSPRGGTFNVSSGQGTTINELFARLAVATNYEKPPRYGPSRKGDIVHSVLDARLADAVLGWRATTSLSEGLAATIRSEAG